MAQLALHHASPPSFDVLSAIHNRYSCRYYDRSAFQADAQNPVVAQLQAFASSEVKSGPFHTALRFSVVFGNHASTAGWIWGAEAFIVGTCQLRDGRGEPSRGSGATTTATATAVEGGTTSNKQDQAGQYEYQLLVGKIPHWRCIVDYGYGMELIVLKATDLGLNTCWMGGIRRQDWEPDIFANTEVEHVCAISPIGKARSGGWLSAISPARGWLSYYIGASGWSGQRVRYPWKQLFFDGNFNNPLTEAQAGEYAACLEAMREAPSGCNAQTWRVIRDTSTTTTTAVFHFFAQPAGKFYGFMNVGIAMCHFELAARQLQSLGRCSVGGAWQECEDAVTRLIPTLPKDARYVVSWVVGGTSTKASIRK